MQRNFKNYVGKSFNFYLKIAHIFVVNQLFETDGVSCIKEHYALFFFFLNIVILSYICFLCSYFHWSDEIMKILEFLIFPNITMAIWHYNNSNIFVFVRTLATEIRIP